MDYYAVLGVETGCSPEEIKDRYLILARLYDQGADDERSVRRLQEVREAYMVLSDPQSRRLVTATAADAESDLPHVSVMNELYPGYSQRAGLPRRVALYAILFSVLALCLIGAIRRGFSVTTQSAYSDPAASR